MTNEFEKFNTMLRLVLFDDPIDARSKVTLNFLDADGALAECSANYEGGTVTWAFIQRICAVCEMAKDVRETQKRYFSSRDRLILAECQRKERELDKVLQGFI